VEAGWADTITLFGKTEVFFSTTRPDQANELESARKINFFGAPVLRNFSSRLSRHAIKMN
jgi:hypothetical protein